MTMASIRRWERSAERFALFYGRRVSLQTKCEPKRRPCAKSVRNKGESAPVSHLRGKNLPQLVFLGGALRWRRGRIARTYPEMARRRLSLRNRGGAIRGHACSPRGMESQPSFASDTMAAIVRNADGQQRVIYALLAGTGLRIRVARPRGVEPPTFWFVAKRSIQLSYGRAVISV